MRIKLCLATLLVWAVGERGQQQTQADGACRGGLAGHVEGAGSREPGLCPGHTRRTQEEAVPGKATLLAASGHADGMDYWAHRAEGRETVPTVGALSAPLPASGHPHLGNGGHLQNRARSKTRAHSSNSQPTSQVGGTLHPDRSPQPGCHPVRH